MTRLIPFLMVIHFCVCLSARAKPACDFPIAATFSEDMITVIWPNVKNAVFYNVYANWGKGFEKVNFSPVRTRNRYTLIWAENEGKKERIVKGNSVSMVVAPVFANSKRRDTTFVVGAQSCPISNAYFTGFSQVLDSFACSKIIIARQTFPLILPHGVQTTRNSFVAHYGDCAKAIYTLYKATIDPHDEGACVPFSTLVSKYFSSKGIPCYRAQGTFMGMFHSFNIVVVDSVEYILDFTANQFVPESAPVFMPRDMCFADSCGMPTNRPHGNFTGMYHIETVFSSDQITFTDTPKARQYQEILDSLTRHSY